MQPDITRARQELELARKMSERLWAELRAYTETLDPGRIVGPEELRRIKEASDWTRKVCQAEHALFGAEHSTPGIVGSHGEYQWVSSVDHDFSGFLDSCPDVVLSKYLAVTRIDGGTLRITDQEKRQGWWTAEEAKVFQGTSWSPPEYRDDWKVAYRPRITSVHGLPRQTHEEYCAGYDEMYVFAQPVVAGELEAFVNWGGHFLYASSYKWCADRFWEQMTRLSPESYVADDGTIFAFATRNKTLFDQVLTAFEARSQPD